MYDNDASTNTGNATICYFEKQSHLLMKFALISVCGSGIAVFGILGNLLVIHTCLLSPRLTANRYYLSALAIFDTFVLICAILIYSVEHLSEMFELDQLYYAWVTYLPFIYGCSHVFQAASVFSMIVGNCERYFAGKRAMHKYFNSKGMAVRWTYATLFLCICLCFPRFLEIQYQDQACIGLGARKPFPSPLARDEQYQLIYSLWISSSLQIILPFVVLFALNFLTLRNLRRRDHCLSVGSANQQNENTSRFRRYANAGLAISRLNIRARRRQAATAAAAAPKSGEGVRGLLDLLPGANRIDPVTRKATLTFVAFVTVFLLCNVWQFVLSCLEVVIGADAMHSNAPDFYSNSRELINFLGIINSAVNFPTYITFSKLFRQELMRHTRDSCACLKKPNDTHNQIIFVSSQTLMQPVLQFNRRFSQSMVDKHTRITKGNNPWSLNQPNTIQRKRSHSMYPASNDTVTSQIQICE